MKQQDEKITQFEKIFFDTKDRLYGFIKGMVHNTSQVQDYMQQCYLKLWEQFDNLDLEKDILPLLYTYARNLVIDHLRKNAREQPVADHLSWENELVDKSSIDHYVTDRENIKNLHDVINRMPPRRKEVFKLIKLEGLSYQEASEQLGISLSTVEKHMHEAYKFLAEWSSALFICSLLLNTDTATSLSAF